MLLPAFGSSRTFDFIDCVSVRFCGHSCQGGANFHPSNHYSVVQHFLFLGFFFPLKTVTLALPWMLVLLTALLAKANPITVFLRSLTHFEHSVCLTASRTEQLLRAASINQVLSFTLSRNSQRKIKLCQLHTAHP